MEKEKTVFYLNEHDWNKFMELLEKPPKPNEALRQLMQSKSTWKE